MGSYPFRSPHTLAGLLPPAGRVGRGICIVATAQHARWSTALADLDALCAVRSGRLHLRLARLQCAQWVHGGADRDECGRDSELPLLPVDRVSPCIHGVEWSRRTEDEEGPRVVVDGRESGGRSDGRHCALGRVHGIRHDIEQDLALLYVSSVLSGRARIYSLEQG